MHFDAYESLDGRKVTAIVYLNRGWTSHHGGELELYPVPEAAVSIDPRFNRMVRMPSCICVLQGQSVSSARHVPCRPYDGA